MLGGSEFEIFFRQGCRDGSKERNGDVKGDPKVKGQGHLKVNFVFFNGNPYFFMRNWTEGKILRSKNIHMCAGQHFLITKIYVKKIDFFCLFICVYNFWNVPFFFQRYFTNVHYVRRYLYITLTWIVCTLLHELNSHETVKVIPCVFPNRNLGIFGMWWIFVFFLFI